MLLEFISRYYKFLWWGLIAIAFLKIIFSYTFHGGITGLNGVIYAVFNWFGEDEKEREESTSRRNFMRFLNLVTFGIYFLIVIIVAVTALSMILGR